MKTYRVNVNGTTYEVTLEDITGTAAAKVPASAPAPAAAPAPASTPAPVASSGGTEMKSPMPGTILSVNVKPGDAVKSGQVLMVLEAMKMENEIMAPCDGTISQVLVNQGATVESGTLLCTIA